MRKYAYFSSVYLIPIKIEIKIGIIPDIENEEDNLFKNILSNVFMVGSYVFTGNNSNNIIIIFCLHTRFLLSKSIFGTSFNNFLYFSKASVFSLIFLSVFPELLVYSLYCSSISLFLFIKLFSLVLYSSVFFNVSRKVFFLKKKFNCS